MTYKETKRAIENIISDIDIIIEKLEYQLNKPSLVGNFEKEKVTDIYNQLLHAYSVKAAILTLSNINL